MQVVFALRHSKNKVRENKISGLLMKSQNQSVQFFKYSSDQKNYAGLTMQINFFCSKLLLCQLCWPR